MPKFPGFSWGAGCKSCRGHEDYYDIFSKAAATAARNTPTEEDYREVFGGERNSSIPTVDVDAVGGDLQNLAFGDVDLDEVFGGGNWKCSLPTYEESIEPRLMMTKQEIDPSSAARASIDAFDKALEKASRVMGIAKKLQPIIKSNEASQSNFQDMLDRQYVDMLVHMLNREQRRSVLPSEKNSVYVDEEFAEKKRVADRAIREGREKAFSEKIGDSCKEIDGWASDIPAFSESREVAAMKENAKTQKQHERAAAEERGVEKALVLKETSEEGVNEEEPEKVGHRRCSSFSDLDKLSKSGRNLKIAHRRNERVAKGFQKKNQEAMEKADNSGKTKFSLNVFGLKDIFDDTSWDRIFQDGIQGVDIQLEEYCEELVVLLQEAWNRYNNQIKR